MKLGFGILRVRRIGESTAHGLGRAIAPSPGELVKDLVIGVTALLLFSLGLYICISGLVIALLALVL